MRTFAVGIRELKNDLSRWVARVKAGEEILVTERGTAVARLLPVDGEDPLARLEEAGLLVRGATRRQRLRPRVRLKGRGPSGSDYVVVGRG